jgi:hypothetical protein
MNGFVSTSAAQVVIVSLICMEAVLALIALTSLARKHELMRYKSLAGILFLMFLTSVFSLLVSRLPRTHLVYESYFYWYWSAEAAGTILMLPFCFGILKQTSLSSPKLQSRATRVFRWIVILYGGIGAAVVVAFEPHLNSRLFVDEVTQLQRLVEFAAFFTAVVVFACIRPFGFELRNRLSGFGLGLGFFVLSIVPSLLSGEIQMRHPHWIAILANGAICAQVTSWIAALSWPEPIRHVVSV